MIADAGGRAIAIGADLRDAADTERLADTAGQALGPVDILVANAGTGAHRRGRSRRRGVRRADRRQPARAVPARRRVLPGMRERGFGRILFTSSVAAFTGGIVGAHYAASKAGLHGITHHLAARVAADGVTVNAIAPALIEDTGLLPGDPGELATARPGRAARAARGGRRPALAILANGYLTNQVVLLDGGMHPR